MNKPHKSRNSEPNEQSPRNIFEIFSCSWALENFSHSRGLRTDISQKTVVGCPCLSSKHWKQNKMKQSKQQFFGPILCFYSFLSLKAQNIKSSKAKRWRQRELQKGKINCLISNNNNKNFARAAHFFYHFFVVAVVPALHWVLFYFTLQETSDYSISLIRDPARGSSQSYLRVAWTSALKQFFLKLSSYSFYEKIRRMCNFTAAHFNLAVFFLLTASISHFLTGDIKFSYVDLPTKFVSFVFYQSSCSSFSFSFLLSTRSI